MIKRWKTGLPLGIAFILLILFGVVLVHLDNNPEATSILNSPLIGKEAPSLQLLPLQEGEPSLTLERVSQTPVSLLTIWASWCVPCRHENKALLSLKEKRPDIPLYGMNYKDKPENAIKFLTESGNPFSAIGIDPKGETGISWGVYGVPETYILKTISLTEDQPPHKKGDKIVTIVYKHIGGLDDHSIETIILPEVNKALRLPDAP